MAKTVAISPGLENPPETAAKKGYRKCPNPACGKMVGGGRAKECPHCHTALHKKTAKSSSKKVFDPRKTMEKIKAIGGLAKVKKTLDDLDKLQATISELGTPAEAKEAVEFFTALKDL